MSDEKIIQRSIVAYGRSTTLACDARCSKAWGINNRPRAYFSEDDEDDYAYLSDDEIAEDAPIDPGTYEGGHAKPTCDADRLNKWCFRECERGETFDAAGSLITLRAFDRRVYNRHDRQAVADASRAAGVDDPNGPGVATPPA